MIFYRNTYRKVFYALVLTIALSLFSPCQSSFADTEQKYRYTNSLISENSPYLLQHAHNPVNWFAWSKQAFLKAKKLNRPIFLSIGYSTCHWCHVMEKESFENLEIAKLLNQNFIAIKVDREQRPDVDALYMKSAMLVNGSGGWPLNVFITPDGEFFYGATYFPPEKFKQVLSKISDLWKNDRLGLIKVAKSITGLVKQQQHSTQSSIATRKIFSAKKVAHYVENSEQVYIKRFDVLQGGFSQAPKFPNEAILFLLMDSITRNHHPELYNALKSTLDAMSNGGIYDHIGGGFHRYSVDNSWFAPHFEKMLYNQAHLSMLYMQFYQLSGQIEYRQIAKQIIDYVIRDMQHKQDFSAFYSASDADSKAIINAEAEEGLFFLWTYQQLKKALSKKEFQLISRIYNFSEQGNFTEAGIGNNILFRDETLSSYAKINNIALKVLIKDVNLIRENLYQLRNNRISPAIDRKIITAWNAMMISSLVKASEVYQNKHYLTLAVSTANYINKYNLDSKSGQLLRSSIDGKSNVLASQQDYAYYAKALVDLYDRTNDRKWLEQSQQLVKQMVKLFEDKKSGAFYQNNPLNEVPLSNRLKQIYDGAMPSGNSIAMEVLGKLSNRVTDPSAALYYQDLIEQMLAYYASVLGIVEKDSNNKALSPMPYLLMAVQKNKNGDSALLQYGANGNLKASLVNKENSLEYQIKVQLQPGWHINSHNPIQKNLIKTKLDLAQKEEEFSEIRLLKNISYPDAKIKKLGFSQTKLSLFEHHFTISFNIEEKMISKRKVVPIKFSFQACSDNTCLVPENIIFYLNLLPNPKH